MIASALTPVVRQLWTVLYAMVSASLVAVPIAGVAMVIRSTLGELWAPIGGMDYWEMQNLAWLALGLPTTLVGLARMASVHATPTPTVCIHATPN